MKPLQIATFQKNLLAWYRKNARKLPWRRPPNGWRAGRRGFSGGHEIDPYKIWVSEIMLQQTQVKTVIPYYEKWIEKFPTVAALAKAPLEDVLKYWAGLGYYRRARMLHQASQKIIRDFKGRIPSTAEELQKIPGIGRYTAGAIASIAFEEKVPVLDGNVIRILTRIEALKQDIQNPKTIQTLWHLAEKILPSKNLGDFNQALMELGATVCLPQNPCCLFCPVKNFCEASKKNPEQFPVKGKKEVFESLETAALLIKKGDQFLIRQQPIGKRWGGLWMFPHWPNKSEMLSEAKLTDPDLKHRMTVKHGFTKYRIKLQVFERIVKNKKTMPKASCALQGRWVHSSELSKYAFPSPHQKIVREILQNAL